MTEPAPGSLEYWARERPDHIAIIEDERTLSYRQWNEASDRLANALTQHGLQQGDIVVVRTQIRMEWPVIGAALGKLGCSLLGLNWRLTIAEVRHVLTDSGACALICDDPDPLPLREAAAGLPLTLWVSIDAAAPGFVSLAQLLIGSDKPLVARSTPSLIVYTSGTTGRPKGVVTGKGSRHFSAEQVQEYGRDIRERRSSKSREATVLITMPMHHGSGPAQVWSTLRNGRRMILMRRFDPQKALALIQQHQVTDWASVPTMLKRMAALPAQLLNQYDVRTIQHLNVGAAPVPYSLKEWALSHFGEQCLTEGYGSTETGMVTSLAPNMQRTKAGSSGLPFKHVSLEIRDSEGHALPAGQTGELWVRTPTTLPAYLNAADLGHDTLDDRGFFRVGDVGYLDTQGYLYITDRAKDLIISGGVNIYPAEIELALLEHPAVLDVAVIGIPDDEFGEQVKVFVELKPGHTLSSSALMDFAAARLASYKRPKSIEFLPELPRNSMGKTLKRELREPYWQGRERKI